MWRTKRKALELCTVAGISCILGGAWIVGVGCGLIITGIIVVITCAYYSDEVETANGHSRIENT